MRAASARRHHVVGRERRALIAAERAAHEHVHLRDRVRGQARHARDEAGVVVAVRIERRDLRQRGPHLAVVGDRLADVDPALHREAVAPRAPTLTSTPLYIDVCAAVVARPGGEAVRSAPTCAGVTL